MPDRKATQAAPDLDETPLVDNEEENHHACHESGNIHWL